MLCLGRKAGEKILIGNDIVLTVISINGSKIRLGIEAPPGVVIMRSELTGIQASALERPGTKQAAPV